MNLYPIVEERPRRRFVDWRFLAALAALLMIAFLAWAGVRNYEIRQTEAEQKDALIVQLAERSGQIERLEAQIEDMYQRLRAVQTASREDAKAMREERAALLRNQRTMIRLLQRHGIVPRTSLTGPAGVVTYIPAPPPSRASGGGGTTAPKASGGTAAPKSAPKSSTSRPKPASPTAGKSGKTPSGKAKGLRKK